MSDYMTKKYLDTRYQQIQNTQKDFYENMNPCSGDDLFVYKNLSIQRNYLQEVLKSEFQFDHNTKKKILDSFQ